jgi:hypothetical protein
MTKADIQLLYECEQCFLFAKHKSVWLTSCNIWRTIPLTIGVKSR